MRLSRALVLACGLWMAEGAAARGCQAQFFMRDAGDSIPMVTATGTAVIPVAPDRAVVSDKDRRQPRLRDMPCCLD